MAGRPRKFQQPCQKKLVRTTVDPVAATESNNQSIMIRSTISALAAAAMVFSATAGRAAADDHEIIEEAMKGGFKGDDSLAKKVVGGKATKEEMAKLKEYCDALVKVKPPVGDEASWKEKTEAMAKAMAAVQAGEADAAKAFEKASNCKACHEVHRPKKK